MTSGVPGIDVIGWHGCALQRRLDEKAYIALMRSQAAGAAAGPVPLDPCPVCMRRDSPAYRFVSYPIEELAERVLFDYFIRELHVPDSPGDQIYRDLVTPAAGPWWEKRGAQGDSTFESDAPFREPLARYHGKEVTTSQVFAALLQDARGLPVVTATGLFWRGFREFVPEALASRSRTLGELVALAPLFEDTFKQAVSGAVACDVLFFP